MVNYTPRSLDAAFAALADPTRRAILARLARGESSVTQLAEPFPVSLPAISKHLGVLERAGLIASEKDGRVRRCRLVSDPMKNVAEWIARYRRFWEEQFDALASYLDESQKQEETKWLPQSRARRRPSASSASSRRRGRRSSRHGPSRIR